MCLETDAIETAASRQPRGTRARVGAARAGHGRSWSPVRRSSRPSLTGSTETRARRERDCPRRATLLVAAHHRPLQHLPCAARLARCRGRTSGGRRAVLRVRAPILSRRRNRRRLPSRSRRADSAAAAISEQAIAGWWPGSPRASGAGVLELGAELVVGASCRARARRFVRRWGGVAADGGHRCAALGQAPVSDALRSTVQLQLARLVDDPPEALRHLEAAFELGIVPRRGTLGGALKLPESPASSASASRRMLFRRSRCSATASPRPSSTSLAQPADDALADLTS